MRFLLCLAVACATTVCSVSAQTWTSASSENWSSGANWSGGIAPLSSPATNLIFSDTTTAYTATNNIGSLPFFLNSIAINNTADTTLAAATLPNAIAFSGTSSALTLASGSGNATVSAGIFYNATTAVSNASANTLLLNGFQNYLSNNTVTYTNSGTGTLTLADAIPYAGSNVTINLANTGTGTLNIGNVGGLTGGTLNTINVTQGTVNFAGVATADLFSENTVLNVATGATFNFNSNSENFGGLSGGGTVIMGSGNIGLSLAGNRTFSGTVSATGSLTQNSTGTFTLSGTSTITGTTVVNRGVLALDFSASTAPPSDILYNGITYGALTINGGRLSVLGSGTVAVSQTVAGLNINGGASLAVTSGNNQNATLVLGAITRTAASATVNGTLNVNLTNVGSGVAAVTTTTLNSGTTGIVGAWATVNNTDWAVTGTTAGTYAITPFAGYVTNTFGTGNHVTLTANQAPTAANVTASNTVRFNAASALTLTLTGVNALAQGGILVTPNVGANATIITGGTSLGSATGVDLIINQSNTAGNLTITTPLAGASTQRIIKTGAGRLILNGAPTFAGRYYFNEGVVQVGALTTVSNVTTVTMTFNGGTVNYTAAYSPGSAGHVATIGAGGGTFDVNSGITLTRNGNSLLGSGPLTKAGAGTFSVGSNSSSFSGTLTVTGGIIRETSSQLQNVSLATFQAGTQFFIDDDANATYRISNGSVIYLNGDGPSNGGVIRSQTQSVANASPTHTLSNELNLQTTSRFSPVNNGTGTTTQNVTGIISGPGGIIKDSTGVLQISNAANTYLGSTIVSNGTIRSGVENALPYTTLLQIGETASANSGTFELNGNNQTVGGLANAGTGTTNQIINSALTASVLTVNNASGTSTYSANLGSATGNNFGITKTGAGTLLLNGTTRTYTGTTTVSGGTLRTPSYTAAGGFAITDGGTLAVTYDATPTSFSTPTLALGTAASILAFELTSSGSAVPLINVTTANGLIAAGGTLRVSSVAQLTAGTITLIDYTGTAITSGFTLGSLPPRTLANLVYNTTNTSIDLSITGVDSIKWNGGISADWDVGSAVNVGGTNNWKEVTSGTITNFITGDTVLFDDTAVGNYAVNLTTAVQPLSITVNNTTAYSFAGPGSIAGTTTLTKNGIGTLTLNNANTFTGTTTLNAGQIILGNVLALQNSTVALATTNGLNFGTLTTATLGGLSGTANLALVGGAGLNVSVGNNNASTTYAGALSGVGGLTKIGTGTLALTGDNLHTGGTTVSAGVLQVGNGGTLGSLAGDVTTTGTGTFAFNRSDTVTFANALTGTGSLAQLGSGTLNVTGTSNSYSTGTTISTGTLAIAGGNFLSSASITLTNSGTLQTTGSTSYTVANTIIASTGGGAVQVSNTAPVTLSGSITGSAALAKTGAGTLILTGNNTGYTGAYQLNAGTLQVAGVGTFGATSGTSATFNGGTLAITADQTTTSAATNQVWNFAGTGTVDIATGVTVAKHGGNITGATGILNKTGGGTLGFQSGGQVTLGTLNILDGIARVTSQRTNTLGAINVLAGGTFAILDTTSFDTTTAQLAIVSGGVLTLNGDGFNAGGAFRHSLDETGSAVAGVNILVNLATTSRFTFVNRAPSDTVTDTFNQVISGATGAGLIKDGSGTMILAAANTYTGNTTVVAGTLALTGTGSFASSPTIAVSTGTTLDVNALTGGANFVGTGFALATGQTLSGNGTVNATAVGVTVGTGTTIAPGTPTTAGTLSITGNTVIGGAITFKLATAGTADNTFTGQSSTVGGHDVLAVTGTLDLTGSTINLSTLSGSGFDVNSNYSWLIATATDGVTGTPTIGSLNGDFAGLGSSFAVVASGNNLLLNFTSPVPEPTTVLLIAAAGLGLGRTVRKRRNG